MGVKAVRYVMEHSRASGGARLVALVLAEHADPDGVCWVGVPLIATEAGMSDRGAQKALRRLEMAGEVQIATKAGGSDRTRADRRPNLYRLIGVSDEVNEVNAGSPRKSLRGEQSDAYEVNDVTSRGEPGFTRTNTEPTTEPTPRAASASPSAGEEANPAGGDERPETLEEDFEAFWKIFPHYPQRAAQRPKTAQAYRELRETGVTTDELATAARHYRTDPGLASDEHHFRWAKDAANFLRGDFWRAYLEPPANPVTLTEDGTPLVSGQTDPRTGVIYWKRAPRPPWMFSESSPPRERELAGVKS